MKSREAISKSSLPQVSPDGDQLESRDSPKTATAQRQREYAKARKTISKIANLIASGSTGGNCLVFDTGDLQIKCHAPKEGNPQISYEFYGTDPDDCFGLNYTKREAIALLAEFELGRFWEGSVYRQQFLTIADIAGVAVPVRRALKPSQEVFIGSVDCELPGHPEVSQSDFAVLSGAQAQAYLKFLEARIACGLGKSLGGAH